jgi:hypothetical protein
MERFVGLHPECHSEIYCCRLGLMTHFGALAAAASGRSPFVAVYPQSTVADNKPCPWYAAWATARVSHPSAVVGGVTAPDRPSPTGKLHFVK